MSKLELPLFQDIQLAWNGDEIVMTAHVLDVSAETLLLRLPSHAADVEQPDTATLVFGHLAHTWRHPARVKEAWGPWWILERPEEDKRYSLQRRAFARIDLATSMLAIPIAPTGQQIGPPIAVSILNLSAGGCMAQSEQGLGVRGTLILLLLALPNLPTIPVVSELVRVPDTPEIGGFYGIQFKNLQPEHQQQLVAFVEAQS